MDERLHKEIRWCEAQIATARSENTVRELRYQIRHKELTIAFNECELFNLPEETLVRVLHTNKIGKVLKRHQQIYLIHLLTKGLTEAVWCEVKVLDSKLAELLYKD